MSKPFRQKLCLFCGRSLRSKKAGGKSNEYIIPNWLIDYLGIRGMTVTPAVTEVASGHRSGETLATSTNARFDPMMGRLADLTTRIGVLQDRSKRFFSVAGL
ncbi:MAG: hypothetical protein ACLP59_00740 [Bryobacteraceae bacterium]